MPEDAASADATEAAATSRPTLILLDGHSLAYRAFYALPDTLRTQTGQLTNAVYGFTSMLIRLLADQRPDAIAVCFDKGRDTVRTAAFPEYKANRVTAPDEFRPQVDLIRQVMEAMEIPMFEVAGIEADDVIATIATDAVAQGFHAYIVTGDRDAMQLAADDLTILYTRRGITDVLEMTPDTVEEKYGITPAQYVDFAAMRGDTSDNLPGVPGVGEKTAAKLLAQFGDLDGLYEHLDEVSGKKVPAMLAEHRDQVFMNRKLMTLRRNVEVEYRLDEMRFGSPDLDVIRQLFGALEFRALYDRLIQDVMGQVEEDDAAGFEVVPVALGPGELVDWLDTVEGDLAVAPIVEGSVPSLRWVAVGLAAEGVGPASARLDDLAREDLVALGDVLADADVVKLAHDVKELDHAAASRGWTLANASVDTLLAAYLLNPEQRSFDLDRVALQHLQRTMTAEESGGGDQLSLEIDDPWQPRAMRAQAVLELGTYLREQLDLRGQAELYRTVELPLAQVLAACERNGITMDLSVLDEIRGRLAERCDALEHEIWDHAGKRFNVGSGPQLQEVLFEELELPKTRKIKTGYSTDAKALQQLEGMHPIVDAIGEWREVSKLLTTYVDALPKLCDPDTSRIHTTFSQTVAATGRLSSSNPNLQNIPVRRAEGREIRKAFVAGEGFDQLLVADYSQIELRIMAHMCEDEGLLAAFRSGEDVHATTAAKVFDLELDEVDGTLRDRAKAINYGLAYGLTAFGLGQQLGIPPDEAQEIVDAYMERFPKVRSFLDQAVLDARRDGHTTTLFGRRRYLPDLLSDNRNRRQMAERMALNAPIQGTAADIMKLAMIRVHDALRASGLRSQMLLQVHDEVILECPDDEVEQATDLVRTAMASVADLAVPLDVDTATGPTWFAAQKH